MELYRQLGVLQRRIAAYVHAETLLDWDAAVHPQRDKEGHRSRGYSMGELQLHTHDTWVSQSTRSLLEQLEREENFNSLTQQQKHNVRAFRNRLEKATRLAPRLESRSARATARHQWPYFKAKNDWKNYLITFEAMWDEQRDLGQQLAASRKMTPYAALVDSWNPGLEMGTLSTVIDQLRGWLPQFYIEVARKHALEERAKIQKPIGPFRVPGQLQLTKDILTMCGFDEQRGRVDPGYHSSDTFVVQPGSDIRLVFAYDVTNILPTVPVILSQAGIAVASQNCPPNELLNPFGPGKLASSMNSSILRDHFGRSAGFCENLSKWMCSSFPGGANEPLFAASKLSSHLTHVSPHYLLNGADEISTLLHLLFRVEMEKGVIGNEIPVAEMPKAWDYNMHTLFGLNTTNQFSKGVLQSHEWPSGMVGYFAGVLMGSIAAADVVRTMRSEMSPSDVAAVFEGGNLGPALLWMKKSLWNMDEEAGAGVNRYTLLTDPKAAVSQVEALKDHLHTRYLK
jgi:carboxypeptidase Taq